MPLMLWNTCINCDKRTPNERTSLISVLVFRWRRVEKSKASIWRLDYNFVGFWFTPYKNNSRFIRWVRLLHFYSLTTTTARRSDMCVCSSIQESLSLWSWFYEQYFFRSSWDVVQLNNACPKFRLILLDKKLFKWYLNIWNECNHPA